MTAPLRVGFAGCGRVTSTLHLPALARVEDIEVVAVADVDGDAARAVAARLGGVRAHDDVSELLSDDVDVVAVCTPPAGHAAIARAALDAGKHVLVEKPLTLDVGTADALVAAGERAPGLAAVGFNLRCHRQVLEAKRGLDAGELGELKMVRMHWSAGPRPAGWRTDRRSGGSALWEMGIHHFDLMRFLGGGEPAGLRAEGDAAATVVTAWSPGGALLVSTLATGTSDGNTIELVGSRATLVVTTYVGNGPHVLPVGRFEGGVATRLRGAMRTAVALPRQLRLARAGGDFQVSFVAEWEAIRDAIRTGGSPPATLADGRAAVTLAVEAEMQLERAEAAA